MKRLNLYAVAFITGFLCVPSICSASPACSFAGVFSTLAMDKSTGDIAGYEIIITLSPEGHEAIFTEAQGGLPIKPIVTDTKIVDGWISFEVLIGRDTLMIKGKPTCEYLDTEFEWSTGSKYNVKIPRRKSFWDTSAGN